MVEDSNTKPEEPKKEENWFSRVPAPVWALLGTLLTLAFGFVQFYLPFIAEQHATQTAQAATNTAEVRLSATVVSETPTLTPTQVITATFTATHTTTPTFTLTPTPPPVNIPGEATVSGLRVRSGPGTGFPQISSFAVRESFEVTGRSADGEWYFVRFRKPGIENILTGWVIARSTRLEGDPRTLPGRASPPTPTPAPIFFITFQNACTNKLTISYDVLGDETRFSLSPNRINQQSLGYGPYLFFVNYGESESAVEYRQLVTITQDAQIFIGCNDLLISLPSTE